MAKDQTIALKIATVLWVIWGAVHTFAGIVTMTGSAPGNIAGIADAVDPAVLEGTYHAAVDGLLNQHGWNLAWAGIVTMIGAVLIWRGNMTAIWVTAMVGGLLDLGYFFFMDLPGFVHFVPGTVMTFISATAILLSGWVWLAHRNSTS